MKKTILALTIPALFATSASAVEIYSAEDGSKVELNGRLQYHAGSFGYQQKVVNGVPVPNKPNGDKVTGEDREHFGGKGQARFGFNAKQVLNQDVALIGKYEANFASDAGDDAKDVETRFAWVGFNFQGTTDLTFGKSEAPRAQLTDLTDTFDIFGGEVTDAGGYNRVDDQVRVAYADNGLDLRAAYAFSDERKDTADFVNNSDNESTRLGLSAGYTLPINLGFVATYNVDNNDNVSALQEEKQKEWGLGAHYTFDGFYVAALYGQRDNKIQAGDDKGTKFWEVQGAYNVEQWTLIANYANEKNRKAYTGPKKEISEYTLAARYALTPKAKLYAEYVIKELRSEDDLYGVGIQYNF